MAAGSVFLSGVIRAHLHIVGSLPRWQNEQWAIFAADYAAAFDCVACPIDHLSGRVEHGKIGVEARAIARWPNDLVSSTVCESQPCYPRIARTSRQRPTEVNAPANLDV